LDSSGAQSLSAGRDQPHGGDGETELSQAKQAPFVAFDLGEQRAAAIAALTGYP
jgi:hypothetical protein